MKASTIAGLGLVAGAAVIEAALIPGLLLGAAAVLAPKLLMRGKLSPLTRAPARAQAVFASVRLPSKPKAPTALSTVPAPLAKPAPFEVKQAVFKTITFRMVASSFDFAANMVVIGDVTTALGLSAFGLAGAPMFYFCHEFFWHRIAPTGMKIDAGTLLPHSEMLPLSGGRGLTINRTLAKTITYEIVATTADFSANYVATRDVVAAAGLTAFAAAIGPFIYFGHEKVWEHFATADSGNHKSILPQKSIPLATPLVS